MNSRCCRSLCLALTAIVSTRADEGMWLFNSPPRAQLQSKYGFELTDAWLDHVMKSCVRFNSGGSGSFVSEDGLVISNHHVGADALQKVSTAEHDYLKNGFYAQSHAEEIPCVDLELNVLQSIEDVTARVNAAVPSGISAEEAFKARRKVIAEIEKESLDKTGLRSNVTPLYQGGLYHLYRFKRYTDIRIVFAPEQQIAFYGGDPDNFEYPRFDLDICLFRVYENGQPIHVDQYLKWSKAGAADGELTFVAGHPGRTERLLTMDELEYQRTTALPYRLDLLKRRESLLIGWSARSTENARRAKEDLFGIQNSRKALDGRLAGLYDPVLMGQKAAVEKGFRDRLSAAADQAEAVAAYQRIQEAQKALAALVPRLQLLEARDGFWSESFVLARTLLRAGDELPKPNGERLEEFGASQKASLELGLFSERPIYPDFEILTLSDSLTFLTEKLGFNDPTVQRVLAGKSPRARATELIQKTHVRDVAFRKRLYQEGAPAVQAANDPMIELARSIDSEARQLRKQSEAQQEIKRQAQGAIARARFKLDGTGSYPDATFTLRLAYGPVVGYTENGQSVPSFTTMAGLYQRAAENQQKPPFDLPASWVKRKSSLNLRTPFNFVSTADIIGGNSGSPVVNQAGEFVGIIFDGNLQSLVLDYAYEDTQARAVSVHSSAILEALSKVYHADALAKELKTGHFGGRSGN